LITGHGWIAAITHALYRTSVIQILLTILVLGFSGRLGVLAEFTAGLIIVALVTVVMGALLPALGAHHHFGIPDNDRSPEGGLPTDRSPLRSHEPIRAA